MRLKPLDIFAAFLTVFLFIKVAHCQEPTGKISKMATAIARTEGFYKKGSVPNRLHNPGDLLAKSAHAYPGQVGLYRHYAVFKNDAWGWAALEKQIQKVIDGTSNVYTQAMTFAQIAKIYAADPHWLGNLCKILKISPRLTFQEYFDLAPRVNITWNTTGIAPLLLTERQQPALSADVVFAATTSI